MKRFIFVLIFISFSSTAFPQWLVDGGNLIWPYGNVKITNGTFQLNDSLLFKHTIGDSYLSYVYIDDGGGDEFISLDIAAFGKGAYSPTKLTVSGSGGLSGWYGSFGYFSTTPGNLLVRYLNDYNKSVSLNATTPNVYIDLKNSSSNFARIFAGTGSPESSVSATVGSIFLRTDGGTGTTLYVKESGTGTTGWVAK
jgi:hypothetical protein